MERQQNGNKEFAFRVQLMKVQASCNMSSGIRLPQQASKAMSLADVWPPITVRVQLLAREQCETA